MPKQSKPKAKKRTPESTAAGRSLLTSLNQALAYARGERVPGIRVTHVQVDRPTPINPLAIRQNLGLSQSRFAARFGFTPATISRGEHGRTAQRAFSLQLSRITPMPSRTRSAKRAEFDSLPRPELRRPVVHVGQAAPIEG